MTQTSRDISSLSATDRLARFLEWPTVRRGPYGWGRVLAGFALLVLGCGLVAVGAGTLLGIGASVEGEPTQPTSPARGVLQAGLPIALWGLVVVAVARMVFRMRVDDLFSHLPGIRWGLLVRAALVALVCPGILFTIMSVVKGRSAQLTTPALLGVLAAVIVIPLQSMAEELIFRGFSMQMVLGKLGTSTARYWVASLVFGILFASIHAASNLTVWLALMAFALLFSYLV
ncbi:CPBP family intramembrane glutamic endopeptidase [Arsenicicoccus sp. oral taxon 190]|uniref:CPBP family intramembrane glutamic endopeptidase n=1 Tax=Arsenicicoccus sp. oral taxon 190 TaxID=1658671 RepID=UPI000679F713|nr:CPBP family intramembrane glutamic endopeptidase [Arsenicicoccus sp. oral taxon 190]AKT50969.1 hypothetical protein ADJ73_05925 [Arsenicicoccus sp. oral taxon 190]